MLPAHIGSFFKDILTLYYSITKNKSNFPLYTQIFLSHENLNKAMSSSSLNVGHSSILHCIFKKVSLYLSRKRNQIFGYILPQAIYNWLLPNSHHFYLHVFHLLLVELYFCGWYVKMFSFLLLFYFIGYV